MSCFFFYYNILSYDFVIRCLYVILNQNSAEFVVLIHKCVISCCKPPEHSIACGLSLKYYKNWFAVVEGVDNEEKELIDDDEEEEEEEEEDDEVEDDIVEDEFNTYDELDLVN